MDIKNDAIKCLKLGSETVKRHFIIHKSTDQEKIEPIC